MDKKQTAVEWLVEQVNHFSWGDIRIDIPKEVIERAKAIEKEQIVKAWNDGDYAYFSSKKTNKDFEDGEEYYNEVYGKEGGEG